VKYKNIIECNTNEYLLFTISITYFILHCLEFIWQSNVHVTNERWKYKGWWKVMMLLEGPDKYIFNWDVYSRKLAKFVSLVVNNLNFYLIELSLHMTFACQ
jgi:hypothetical protein